MWYSIWRLKVVQLNYARLIPSSNEPTSLLPVAVSYSPNISTGITLHRQWLESFIHCLPMLWLQRETSAQATLVRTAPDALMPSTTTCVLAKTTTLAETVNEVCWLTHFLRSVWLLVTLGIRRRIRFSTVSFFVTWHIMNEMNYGQQQGNSTDKNIL